MNFQGFEDLIKNITENVVDEERAGQGRLWLENKCSQVCYKLKRRFEELLGDVTKSLQVEIPKGYWNGGITIDFYKYEGVRFNTPTEEHEWIHIMFATNDGNVYNLEFDPTYIQFTRTDYDWEESKQAVIDNCEKLKSNNSTVAKYEEIMAERYGKK
jgi:hypothetical protein